MTEDYERAEKQNYLRERIVEGNYDPQAFVEYMQTMRGIVLIIKENGGDIDNWNYEELKEMVDLYIEKNPHQDKEEAHESSPTSGGSKTELPSMESAVSVSNN